MHVRRDSVFGILIFVGWACPAMSHNKISQSEWKRQVVPSGPMSMAASCARLEETGAETLDSARKGQREAESSEPAESSGSAVQSGGPSVHEDMRDFRYRTMTPASFVPQRHLFICAGRPMVVPCFMYSPHLQPFSCQVSVTLRNTRHRIIPCHGTVPCYGIVLGRVPSSDAFRTHASFGVPSPFFAPIFFKVYCACIHLHPWSLGALLSGAHHEPRKVQGAADDQLFWEEILSSPTDLHAGAQLQSRSAVQGRTMPLRQLDGPFPFPSVSVQCIMPASCHLIHDLCCVEGGK